MAIKIPIIINRSDLALANLQNGLASCLLFQKISNLHSSSVIKVKVFLKYAPGTGQLS